MSEDKTAVSDGGAALSENDSDTSSPKSIARTSPAVCEATARPQDGGSRVDSWHPPPQSPCTSPSRSPSRCPQQFQVQQHVRSPEDTDGRRSVVRRSSFMMADVLAPSRRPAPLPSSRPAPLPLPSSRPVPASVENSSSNSLSILQSIQKIVENHARLLHSPLDRRKRHHTAVDSDDSESAASSSVERCDAAGDETDTPPFASSTSATSDVTSRGGMRLESPLNFSIDNILRPDFCLATRLAQIHAFQTAVAAAAAAAAVAHSRTDTSVTSVTSTTSPSPGPDQQPVDLRPSKQQHHALSPRQLHRPHHFTRDSLPQHQHQQRHQQQQQKSQLTQVDSSKQNDKVAVGDETKWPAWVYCTRYSDRPSSGPRIRKIKKQKTSDEKRPRTAFSSDQLARLKMEFQQNRYLTEKRRQDLAGELQLNESQIKIWFQNKRAKLKKTTGNRNPLALSLMTEGLYNHSTMTVDEDE